LSCAQSFFDSPLDPPDIWGYHTLVETYQLSMTGGPKIAFGAGHQFGTRLGRHLVDVGIGPRIQATPTSIDYLIVPNRLVYGDFQQETLAG
jgi:hypothetical protein